MLLCACVYALVCVRMSGKYELVNVKLQKWPCCGEKQGYTESTEVAKKTRQKFTPHLVSAFTLFSFAPYFASTTDFYKLSFYWFKSVLFCSIALSQAAIPSVIRGGSVPQKDEGQKEEQNGMRVKRERIQETS